MDKYSVCNPLSKDERDCLASYDDFISHLLFHRGIKTDDEANQFLNLNYDKNIHDPFLLKDMEKACARLKKAFDTNEKICIFSDYDADGIPGAAILIEFFKKIKYTNFFYYIPHRNKEGFGLNNNAIEKIKEQDATLIVTIDCGIADVSQVDFANELGIDVIITDHHEANGHNPQAFAIINPKQNDCSYPEKMLCGSGVIFKLVQALIKKYDFDISTGWEKNLLDLVAIATLSDMVPLRGENRALASFGLTVLRMSPRKGLQKLFSKIRLNQKLINEDDVGFMIAPRINAASRMGEPGSALELLLAKDYGEADVLVNHLHHKNEERKGYVASIVKEVKNKLNLRDNKKIIAEGNVSWQPSLLGLAANTLSEEYNCPVFLWGRGDGFEIKGSCRCDNRHSVIDFLNSLSKDILITYGGHHQAGGFVLQKDKVDFLYDALSEIYEKMPETRSLQLTNIDYVLAVKDINEKLWQSIQKIAPFGIDNPKPLFLFKDLDLLNIKNFGKKSDHLSITISGGDNNQMDAIAFYKDKDSWGRELNINSKIDLIAQIEKDNFSRNKKFRLRIVDII